MEFANVGVKRNWCTPYLISRKLGAPSSGRHFSQHFIHQRQVIDVIDPYLIQPIILRIYHGCGDGHIFFSCPAPLQKFLTIRDNSLQLCALRIMISRAEQESENASIGQKYTKTNKQNTPKYSFSQPVTNCHHPSASLHNVHMAVYVTLQFVL